MTTREALLEARRLFLGGTYSLDNIHFAIDAVRDACAGDAALIVSCVTQLDAVTPGMAFSVWVDGARWGEGDSIVYAYDRRPSEIAALFGKAAQRPDPPAPSASWMAWWCDPRSLPEAKALLDNFDAVKARGGTWGDLLAIAKETKP